MGGVRVRGWGIGSFSGSGVGGLGWDEDERDGAWEGDVPPEPYGLRGKVAPERVGAAEVGILRRMYGKYAAFSDVWGAPYLSSRGFHAMMVHIGVLPPRGDTAGRVHGGANQLSEGEVDTIFNAARVNRVKPTARGGGGGAGGAGAGVGAGDVDRAQQVALLRNGARKLGLSFDAFAEAMLRMAVLMDPANPQALSDLVRTRCVPYLDRPEEETAQGGSAKVYSIAKPATGGRWADAGGSAEGNAGPGSGPGPRALSEVELEDLEVAEGMVDRRVVALLAGYATNFDKMFDHYSAMSLTRVEAEAWRHDLALQTISLGEFIRMCRDVQILPDLLNRTEVCRLFDRVAARRLADDDESEEPRADSAAADVRGRVFDRRQFPEFLVRCAIMAFGKRFYRRSCQGPWPKVKALVSTIKVNYQRIFRLPMVPRNSDEITVFGPKEPGQKLLLLKHAMLSAKLDAAAAAAQPRGLPATFAARPVPPPSAIRHRRTSGQSVRPAGPRRPAQPHGMLSSALSSASRQSSAVPSYVIGTGGVWQEGRAQGLKMR